MLRTLLSGVIFFFLNLTIWIKAECDFHPFPLSLNVVDNGTGPFNEEADRACMGFFGRNKIDFPSPTEGSLDDGCM